MEHVWGLEPGITLPMIASLSPWEGFSSTCSSPPGPLGPAPCLLPYSDLLALPFLFRPVRGPDLMSGRPWSGAHSSSLTVGRQVSSQLSLVGPQHVPRDSAGQTPHLPPIHALCGSWWGGCPPRGLSAFGWGGRQAQEKGGCLAQLPHPKQSLDYCFSGWWEGEPGGGWAAELPNRVSRHLWGPALDLLIPPRPRQWGISQQRSNILARNQRRQKTCECEGTMFPIFEQRSPNWYFCPRPCKLCSQSYK